MSSRLPDRTAVATCRFVSEPRDRDAESSLHVTVRASIITFPAKCPAVMMREALWTVGRLTLRASRVLIVDWDG